MLRKGLVIYEPKGRAGEYCPLAVNLYRGCGHGCLYCYGPDTLHIDRQEFKQAAPRQDIIKKLERDIPLATADGASGNVWLCVTSDSHQPINEIHQLTRQAIIILHANGFNVTILTKGGNRSMADIDLLRPGLDEYAVTLTCTSDSRSKQWEPNAAPPWERINALIKAHDKGIYTWVSMEPVLYPEQSLALIKMSAPYVDEFKLGVLNYHPHAATINWREYGTAAIDLVNSLRKKLYIKEDLKRKL